MIRPDQTMVELDDEEEESHDMEVHMSCHLNDFISYFVCEDDTFFIVES